MPHAHRARATIAPPGVTPLESLLQRSRFELKYLIGEPTAHEVRQFARNHLMPDPFADASRGYSYNIYSVYLDNAGLSLMH